MDNLVIRNYETQDNNEVKKLHELALRATGAFFEHGNWNDDLDDIEGIYLKDGEFIVGMLGRYHSCHGRF